MQTFQSRLTHKLQICFTLLNSPGASRHFIAGNEAKQDNPFSAIAYNDVLENQAGFLGICTYEFSKGAHAIRNLTLNRLALKKIPAALEDLTHLRALKIIQNPGIASEIPSFFANFQAMEYLDLTNNTLDGSIDMLTGLTSLKKLTLLFNKFSGVIPDTIGDLINLEYLALDYNQFSEISTEPIGNLKKLKRFTLKGNNFSGSFEPLVDAVKTIKGFELLKLGENCFEPRTSENAPKGIIHTWDTRVWSSPLSFKNISSRAEGLSNQRPVEECNKN